MRTLSSRFTSPAAADEYYKVHSSAEMPPSAALTTPATVSSMPDSQLVESGPIRVCQQALQPLDADHQLKVLSELFSSYLRHHSHVPPPHDLLRFIVLGMECLKNAGRSNVIYLLAKALGTNRPDGSGSLLPVSRMPMGLVEHIVTFFTASSVQQVCFYCDYTLCIINNVVTYRCLVPVTTVSGCRLCMSCLGPSGQSCFVAQCGAMSLSCRQWRAPSLEPVL